MNPIFQQYLNPPLRVSEEPIIELYFELAAKLEDAMAISIITLLSML
jgi:hypothetical protein